MPRLTTSRPAWETNDRFMQSQFVILRGLRAGERGRPLLVTRRCALP